MTWSFWRRVNYYQKLGGIIGLTFFLYIYTHVYYPDVVPYSSFEEVVNCSEGQDDPRLIKYIQVSPEFLVPPSREPYQLNHPFREDHSEGKIAIFIEEILKEKQYGTFVEAGAFDGEGHSPTLYFERSSGWTGLLIEASPSMQEEILKRHRKAWLMRACISLEPKPMQTKFIEYEGMLGRIANSNEHLDTRATYECRGEYFRLSNSPTEEEKNLLKQYNCTFLPKNHTLIDVKCLPLYSMLLATGLTTLDFLSVDTEGAELKILQTIPFDKVNIKFIRVEVAVLKEEEKEEVNNLMKSVGYTMTKTYKDIDVSHIEDELYFVRNDIL